MKRIALALVVGCTILLTACGGGGTNSEEEPIYEAPSLNVAASINNTIKGILKVSDDTTDEISYSVTESPKKGELKLNKDGSYEYTPKEDAIGFDTFGYVAQSSKGKSNNGIITIEFSVISACLDIHETLLSTEFSLNKLQKLALATMGEKKEMAGFVLETTANTTNPNASRELDFISTKFSSLGYQLVNISKRKDLLSTDSLSAIFKASRKQTEGDITTLDAAHDLIAELTTSELTNFPNSNETDMIANEFRVYITVLFHSKDSVVVIFGIIPELELESFEPKLAAFAQGGNIANCGSNVESKHNVFLGKASTTNLADFLFVVDNSGSMSDEQNAVRNAADEFASVMANANLDYRLGIITTDSDILRGEGFTNDMEAFKQNIVVGINGSGNERGIYFAEKSLQTATDTVSNGTVTSAGFPRQDATLSVIILSDEPSHYSSRSQATFDPNNNLFIDNNYRVYSIIDERYNDQSQYDDLSLSTGGSIASIDNPETFPAIMEQIANNAGGATSSYTLTGNPINTTIKVSVKQKEVIRSTTDGWNYIPLSNSIVFYGSAIPKENDRIEVSYTSIVDGEATQ